MKLVQHVVMGLAVATGISQAQAQPLPSTPAAPSMSEQPTAFAPLLGRWVRLDGGYVISIKAVDASGKLDAGYANPNLLPFHTATVTEDGGTLKLLFELRAGGYNGSTYTLNYDAIRDQLRGVYYQAVAKQSFEVVFIRK